jgi:hypothetical protein
LIIKEFTLIPEDEKLVEHPNLEHMNKQSTVGCFWFKKE